MKINDYIYRLEYEIDLFEMTYNKSPNMLIMSSALASHISNDMDMYIRSYTGMIGQFHGIPVMIYASDKLECHLVESTCNFD